MFSSQLSPGCECECKINKTTQPQSACGGGELGVSNAAAMVMKTASLRRMPLGNVPDAYHINAPCHHTPTVTFKSHSLNDQ